MTAILPALPLSTITISGVFLLLKEQEGGNEGVCEDTWPWQMFPLGSFLLEKLEPALSVEQVDVGIVGVEFQFCLEHVVQHDCLLFDEREGRFGLNR